MSATTSALNQANNILVEKKAKFNRNAQMISPNPTASTVQANQLSNSENLKMNQINYKNGKKIEPMLFSYTNYYSHREKLPQHFHPLVQYLENTELKYHNDNLYENSPIGFPTRAQ
jgi:hypothetical protein